MKRQYATFKVGEALCGIDVLLVDEANRHLDIVPIAGAPTYVCGLLNLRGQIVTVIDLAAKIGMGEWERTSKARCVVLKTSRMIRHFREDGVLDDDTSSDTVGILVSCVEDIVQVEDSDIDPAPANVGDVASKFVTGVVQLKNELLCLLRVSEVVALDEAETVIAA